MESIAQFFVASADLVEAEGRALKRAVIRMVLAIGVSVIALALVLAGLGFILFGLFALLAQHVGGSNAALIFGVIAFVAAATAGFFVKKLFA